MVSHYQLGVSIGVIGIRFGVAVVLTVMMAGTLCDPQCHISSPSVNC